MYFLRPSASVKTTQRNTTLRFLTHPYINVIEGSLVRREVTAIAAIYRSEQWGDFTQPTDAASAVIAAALVPTPPPPGETGEK